ncbi:ATP-binding protein [Actinomadura barringtoniae]|uniref:ATP-binding protein n=1 Tax=Actinomadura barringtoniae TaxID=1427535 RepID=A0A939P5I1_9ACTN|nr:ATP-binding protein [Actinomadura barringtoniae]MBO2445528.1 ATP-binding protein [Actinomadura barringtoniae]
MPPGIPDDRSYRLVLSIDAKTVRVPRKLAEVALENWGLSRLAPTVALVVTELVTNAWKEVPGSEVEIGLYLRGIWLRLEVWDCSNVIPEMPKGLDLEAEGGRGLWVASHMADKFGIDPRGGGGKTIWAMWLRDVGT